MTPKRFRLKLGLLSLCWFLCQTGPASGVETGKARLVIDPARSEARFRIKATGHDVVGRSSRLKGRVVVGGASLADARDAEASLPAASLDAGNALLNRNMRGRLEAGKHPEIQFRALRFEATGEGPPAEGSWRGVMHGELTVRGVIRPVEFLVAARREGHALHAEGWSEFKLTYFGINPPRYLGFLRVKDFVRVEFEVVAARDADGPRPVVAAPGADP